MIAFVYGTPSDEEIAAVIGAITAACHAEPVEAQTQHSVWALAARHPELDIADLRAALRQAQGDTGRVF